MRTIRNTLVAICVICCAAAGPTVAAARVTGRASVNPGYSISLGYRSLSSGCHIRRGNLPDPRCTPGAVFSRADRSMICVRGYTSKVRHVSYATKQLVYHEYGIYSHRRGQYEVDHLVPLEGGGSNAVENLFPQPAGPYPGFHQKDSLENEMNRRICSGRTGLRVAQKAIAKDWLGLYHRWL